MPEHLQRRKIELRAGLDAGNPKRQYISNSPCSAGSTLNDEMDGAIPGEEDVLRVKRSPFRLVLLSASFGSLAEQRSFAPLRACPRAKRRDDKARWSLL